MFRQNITHFCAATLVPDRVKIWNWLFSDLRRGRERLLQDKQKMVNYCDQRLIDNLAIIIIILNLSAQTRKSMRRCIILKYCKFAQYANT